MNPVDASLSIRRAAAFFLFVAILASCGCGREGGDEGAELSREPFVAAMGAYLEAKNFEMKVSSVEQLVVSGAEARAVCKLKHADEAAGLAVTWEFRFEGGPDAWRVVNHAEK